MGDSDIVECSHQGSGKRLTSITMYHNKVRAIEPDIVRKAPNGLSQYLVHRRSIGVIHIGKDVFEPALLDFPNSIAVKRVEVHASGENVQFKVRGGFELRHNWFQLTKVSACTSKNDNFSHELPFVRTLATHVHTKNFVYYAKNLSQNSLGSSGRNLSKLIDR